MNNPTANHHTLRARSQSRAGRRERSLPQRSGWDTCRIIPPSVRTLCLALLACAWATTPLWSAPRLTARLNRDVVPVGESVVLSLTFEEAAPQTAPQLPPLTGLQVLSVSQSQAVQIINGRTRMSVTYNYTLTPTAPGDIAIPPIPANVDGQTLTTPPLSFRVVQRQVPAGAGQGATNSVFLTMNTAKDEICLGEALPVEITLYVVQGQSALMPQLAGDGFTSGPMEQQPQNRTRVGNQLFTVVPFRSFVTAARSGSLTLGPASMSLEVPGPNARRDFFGRIIGWQQVNLRSNTKTIRVLPLPTNNVPASFTGAVGTFALAVTATPTNLSVGDPITVTIRISGQGWLDRVLPAPQPQWSEFKTYPPNSSVQPADAQGLSGTKTFEQVVIPQNHEIAFLPPYEFTYFDVSRHAYRTLTNQPIPLSVRPSSFTASPPNLTNAPAGPRPEPPVEDVLHIKARLDELRSAGPPLIARPGFLTLQMIPLLFWLSLLITRKRREALARNPQLRRQREVATRVREGLQELRQAAAQEQAERFFAVLFRLLQEQLGERLDLPASAITEAVITERVAQRGLAEQTLANLHELFQACNQARYASHRSSQELSSLTPTIESVFAELRTLKK